MLKRYHIKEGLLFSSSIAIIPTLARLARQGNDGWFNAMETAVYAIPLAMLFWLIHQVLLQQKFRWAALNHNWSKAVMGILLCGITALVYDRLYNQIHRPPFPIYGETIKHIYLVTFIKGLIIGWFQFMMVYYLRALFENQKAKIEIERLKQENLQAQLNTLQQQTSPHFLFNSLSTLKSIAQDKPSKEYIQQLSNVYRYSLTRKENNLTTVADEMEFVNAYLYILRQRFEDGLQVSIDIAPNLLQNHIPPFALQLLFENAVKHNAIGADQPLQIDLYNEADQWLVVKNNLKPKLQADESTGRGLTNLRHRYQLIAGKDIEVSQTTDLFLVKIPILP